MGELKNFGTQFTRIHVLSAAAVVTGASLSGCLPTPGSNARLTSATVTATTSSSSSSASYTPAAGARAAKIIFKQHNPAGSFDAPNATGTAPVPASGHSATRVFNADGSLLAASPSAGTWPKWIYKVEIGISGSSNTAATNVNCARFAANNEDTDNKCEPTASGSGSIDCGAASGLFRVSEYDCTKSPSATNGNGGPNDGVYFRVYFNRSQLSASENVLAVLEYASSVLNPAPAQPTSCFSGGIFTPTSANCSDMTWQIYLKHNEYEIVQPYLMLVPPAFGHVNADLNTLGSGVSTKQFFLPLAGDANLTVAQVSRIRALPNTTTDFQNICDPDLDGIGNSPLCVGMILYSLTLVRI